MEPIVYCVISIDFDSYSDLIEVTAHESEAHDAARKEVQQLGVARVIVERWHVNAGRDGSYVWSVDRAPR